jgi:twitching motility protein PilT
MPRIDRMFDRLLELKGSDLHLGVGVPPLGRVRGELVTLREREVDTKEMERLLLEITSTEQRDQILSQWDLDFAYPVRRQGALSRQLLLQANWLGAVFRTIPEQDPHARRSQRARRPCAGSRSDAPGWCW